MQAIGVPHPYVLGAVGWSIKGILMVSKYMYVVYVLVGLLLMGGCRDDSGAGSAEPTDAKAALTSRTVAETPRGHIAPNYPTPRRQAEEFLAMVPPKREPAEIELVSVAVTKVPTIDGRADEPVWEGAPAITTLDFSSQRPITLKSVHTNDQLFFLVTYPDKAPSETHKSWGWDAQEDIYRQMHDREDMFVFKWSLVGNDINLALRQAQPHRADVWFWKARRTNLSGYADDKWHVVSPNSYKKAREVASPTHGTLHFRRVGDAGQSAYEERLIYRYQADIVPRFYPRQPQGSRADIRAKGVWHDGRWTLEFARQLKTGHDNDLAFSLGGVYLFAVSCYEMASDTVHPEWFQPIYRTGDAFDRLLLRIATADHRMAERDDR